MKEFQCVVSYFSPTGTTYKIVREIAEGSGLQIEEMDLTSEHDKTELADNAVLIAAMPVYGGRIPGAALERLGRLHGTGQKAVAVVVYGNREFDDALLELKNEMEKMGFQVIAAGAFVAEHSIVRSIAAGRPDGEDLKIARQFGADLVKKICCKDTISVSVPGNVPYVAIKPFAVHPAADEKCTQCRICAEQCPVGAIPLEDPMRTLDVCINCMRCVKVCPEHSRTLPVSYLEAVKKVLEEKASGYKRPRLFGL